MTPRAWNRTTIGLLAAGGGLLGVLVTAEGAAAQTEEVAAAIYIAAERHGVSEPRMRCMARLESTYRPWVTSRGGHAGLFQYSWRTWTWASADAGRAGASPYDPWAAADVTAHMLARGLGFHWSTNGACRGAW